MRRAIAMLGFLSAFSVAGASFMVVPNATSRAAGHEASFLIPASEGYGVADCLSGGKECGSIVADAYCEAHGFSRAAAFGPAPDVTGSTEPGVPSRAERPITITCAG